MNKIMMQQYNMLSKDMQQEVQHYIEYLFAKMKKIDSKNAKETSQQEKNRAYDILMQYAGCIPSDIDYKHDIAEETVKKYESLT